jgi:hypothetical protein
LLLATQLLLFKMIVHCTPKNVGEVLFLRKFAGQFVSGKIAVSPLWISLPREWQLTARSGILRGLGVGLALSQLALDCSPRTYFAFARFFPASRCLMRFFNFLQEFRQLLPQSGAQYKSL